MNILRFLLSSFLWAMGGIFVLAIYAYSELVYLIFICIAIVGLTIYYRKSIIKMYAEIFNELGINKYVIQIKNSKEIQRTYLQTNQYNRSMMIVFFSIFAKDISKIAI